MLVFSNILKEISLFHFFCRHTFQIGFAAAKSKHAVFRKYCSGKFTRSQKMLKRHQNNKKNPKRIQKKSLIMLGHINQNTNQVTISYIKNQACVQAISRVTEVTGQHSSEVQDASNLSSGLQLMVCSKQQLIRFQLDREKSFSQYEQ